MRVELSYTNSGSLSSTDGPDLRITYTDDLFSQPTLCSRRYVVMEGFRISGISNLLNLEYLREYRSCLTWFLNALLIFSNDVFYFQ